MRAIVLHEYGGNDKLQYTADYPTPRAREGDVVVRVRASSINYHDVLPIDKSYPLEQAMEAVRLIEDRAVFGKVVVTP
jgi:NADPH:quinone reductase-like Zn-dependent oxidoreductase